MLIGITGKKRHGKDTAATALTEDGFTPYLFALKLKWMTEDLIMGMGYGYEEVQEFVHGHRKEEVLPYANQTPRQIMQDLGTFGRNLNENLWVDMVLNAIRASNEPNVVITDVRYPNEVEAVKNFGGYVIRVVRPGIEDNEFSSHPSEVSIATLPVHAEIINDGTVADLHAKVRSFCKAALNGRHH